MQSFYLSKKVSSCSLWAKYCMLLVRENVSIAKFTDCLCFFLNITLDVNQTHSEIRTREEVCRFLKEVFGSGIKA